MKRTKKVYQDGFYIFESRVAANSNYIESIQEAKLLMVYARYYLKNYLIIHDYVITRHGWQMAVKIDITESTCFDEDPSQIWRVISERIRLMLSSYVKRVNSLRGRTGVLVHSNYKRYYFESLEEANGHMDNMRNQRIRMYQRKKKYRGLKCHYRVDKSVERGSIFLCSKELREGKSGERRNGSQLIWAFQSFVGSNLIINTKRRHILLSTTSKHPNSS